MKRKFSNGLYKNKIYRGWQSEEHVKTLFKKEDNEIRNAKYAYLEKLKDFKPGDIVNGYRFVKGYSKFNLWEKLSDTGKVQWRTAYFKNETPAPYNRERYKEGDLALETLSREEHHTL